MAQELVFEFKGLFTNTSPETAPAGSLIKAENVGIDSPNTVTSRRGFKQFGAVTNTDAVNLAVFDSSVHEFSGSGTISYDTTGTGVFADYTGTFLAADANIGYRALEYNDNLYFTTDLGPKKIESTAGGTIAQAGIPRGIDGTAAVVVPAGTGFLANGDSVAYRIVWGKNFGNGIISRGAPSERIEVTNAAGALRDVDVTFNIPDDIDATFFYQVYRSASVTGTPNDELGLVIEADPTAGEITAGTITVTDITPDTLRGATIYTAQTQEGILNANVAPPFAKDIALYKDVTMYANTRIRHSLELTLLGAGGTGGIQNGDTLTVGGVVLTGAAVENLGLDEFQIFTAGSAAQNIADTAKSIVKVFNQSASNTAFYGYYTSNFEDLPGRMLFERRTLLATSFTISYTGANASAWAPDLTNSITSINEVKPNRIYFSKPFQPEAVPILSFLDAGTDDTAIQRIIPLKNSVFVMKEDGEVYRIIGETFINFQINLFDSTTRIYGPKTAATFNNQVWMFSDQGVVSIGDAGVQVRSWDIENLVKPFLSTANFPDFEADAWAIPYDSDRKYMFSDGTTIYVYNSFTNAWSTWEREMEAGVWNTVDNRLYMIEEAQVYQERKDLSSSDFADNEYATVIVSVDNPNNQVDLNFIPAGVVVGDELEQSGSVREITDITGVTLTLDAQAVWTVDPATIYQPIKCLVKTNDTFADNFDLMKRYRELFIGFRELNREFTVRFFTNFDPTTGTEIELFPTLPGTAWGSGPWGNFIWGGGATGPQNKRTYFPQEQQRALWNNIEVETTRVFTMFSLNKMAFTYEVASERFPG